MVRIRLPGTVSMARGGQRAVERQQSQVGDVVYMLDGTSTFTNDTRSVMSVYFICLVLYTLRPPAALTVHRLKLAYPLTHLRIVTSLVSNDEYLQCLKWSARGIEAGSVGDGRSSNRRP